jgi:hypothetical protein
VLLPAAAHARVAIRDNNERSHTRARSPRVHSRINRLVPMVPIWKICSTLAQVRAKSNTNSKQDGCQFRKWGFFRFGSGG